MTITVDNLSKRYLINHQAKANYQTLREKLSAKAMRLFSKKKDESLTEEFWALRDICFEAKQGDRIAIIGRNGAGKSTLLKILSRITPPTHGRITLGGRVSSLLEVGTGFHPELTGRENIYLNGALIGMSKAEIKRKFDQIVDFADVEQFLDTPVKRYSSGMYVRLAFAVSAHLEPDILFIDEVLAVGDARFQKKCIGKMEEVAKEGRTILFVTHNMGTVGFCNKGILLEKGRIIPTDSLQDCIQQYHSTHAATGLAWTGDAGDNHVRIKSFRMIAEDNSSIFKKNHKGKVEAIFQVLKPTPDLVVGYFGFNKFGAHILHYKVCHNDQAVFSVAPGTYKVITDVDFSIFSAGIFRLELDIGIHNVRRITTPDIQLQFEVFNDQKKYGEPENTIHPVWASSLAQEPLISA
jgi:lipopolysaccharide transport system ATP-binding protein